jgi:hypothetical protein
MINDAGISERQHGFIKPAEQQLACERLLQLARDQQQWPRTDPKMHLGQDALVGEDSNLLHLADRQLDERP